MGNVIDTRSRNTQKHTFCVQLLTPVVRATISTLPAHIISLHVRDFLTFSV